MELKDINQAFLTCKNCNEKIKDKSYILICLGKIRGIQNYSNIFMNAKQHSLFDFEKYSEEDLKYSNINIDIENLGSDIIVFHKKCFESVSGGGYF